MLTHISGWLRRLKQIGAMSREPGQIIVLFAVFLITLMVLAGSAYDYASIVVDDARLQNAVDAAALAGSNSLSANGMLPGASPVAIAQATTQAYLSMNGVATATPGTNVVMAFPASTQVPGGPVLPAQYDTIQLSVTRSHATFFWPLVGVSNVTMHDSGFAHAARNMVDVMLSLDTTGSEVISGSFPKIQEAVGAFVAAMNPTTTDTRGPQIGIGRFAGIQCQYNGSNYNVGCVNDFYLLSKLTRDGPTLLTIGNGGSGCPVGDLLNGGCPISHVYYNASDRATTTSPSIGGSYDPAYTGTKLPNGFSVLGMTGTNNPYGFGSTYAWSTLNNGRNDPTPNSPLNARKVMVLMTDGQNEMWPLPGPGGIETVANYDTQVQDMANTLQKGPDGIAGTYDDVEIYVVGYFCPDYSGGGFCQSELASTPPSPPRACPGPVMPPTASNIDRLLNSVASSTGTSCDHYFPISKDDTGNQGLAGLFAALAGRISRGALTQ